ncbi:hypothetical protein Tco_0033194 [Tanacetum coccineum]
MDKRVIFTEPVTSSGNTIIKTASTSNLVSNKPMLSSTGVKLSTSASRSQPSGNTKKDKIRQTPRTANVQHSKLNANSELKCVKCNGCMLSDNHDLRVLDFINNVNVRVKSKSIRKSSKRKVWKPTGKVFTNIGYIWRPTGRTFTIVGNACPLTRIITTTEVPLRKPTFLNNEIPKPVITLVYSRKPRKSKTNVPVSKSKVLKSVSANKKEPSTVKFRNDHVANILGYGDYQIGNVTISMVYYVEGLGHNLFSVGQFCDSNLEVAFRQHTCFIHNLEGVDLLTRSRGNNLYTLSLGDMMASSPICLLSKASKTKSSLWHRRPALHKMTPATISSGLVPNPPPSTPFVPPSRTDWDLLFQPLFDELLTPPPSVDHPAPEVIVPIAEIKAILKHLQSSPSDSIHTIMHPDHQISKHNSKWTKDHPLENIIGALKRPVSARLQLHEKALFCYYDAFLTAVEPKTYKDALTQSCWIEAMQEELNEFERLEVWELVPRPDKPADVGLWIPDNPNHVYKLKKARYGFLKHSSTAWYDIFLSFLISQTSTKAQKDPTLFHPVELLAVHQKTQKSTATSSTEAEYYCFLVPDYCAQVLWMRSQLTDYGFGFNKIPIYCDNKSDIALCCNNVQYSRSKHIDIRFHFIKEHVENGVIELYLVDAEYQLADIFTKALCRERIEFLINKIRMRSFTPETLKQLADEVDE